MDTRTENAGKLAGLVELVLNAVQTVSNRRKEQEMPQPMKTECADAIFVTDDSLDRFAQLKLNRWSPVKVLLFPGR